jgi:hypothetical protein
VRSPLAPNTTMMHGQLGAPCTPLPTSWGPFAIYELSFAETRKQIKG